MSVKPESVINGCIAVHRRLEAAIAVVTDEIARRPSLLEGWSVGHVLNHLARNADSHSGVFEAAARGEIRAQYPGGQPERARLIEEGAGLPAHTLIENITTANARLELAWSAVSAEQWTTGLGLRHYGAASLADFAFLRWREVELHSIDLGLADLGGPDWDGLSDGYLPLEMEMFIRGLPARLPAGVAVHLMPNELPATVIGQAEQVVPMRAPGRALLRWLTGRGAHEGWPVLAPW